jgi:hypothetical protein
MKAPLRVLTGIIAGLTIASCASVESSSEYKALNAQVASTEKKLSDLRSTLQKKKGDFEDLKESQSAEIAEASSQLDAVKQEREANRRALAAKLESPQVRSRVIQEFVTEACKKHGYYDLKSVGVRDGRDDMLQWVKEQVNSDWDFNVSGFAETDTFGSASPQSLLTFNDAAEGPCNSATRRGEEDFYDECRSLSRMQLKKNPEQYKGECIRGSIRIAQYDSNTGPCSFQGYFGGGYDVRVQVGTTLDTATHATAKECDWLDKLVEDKYIEVWAFVLGSYQYSTTSGGNQTVPALRLVAWR